MKSQLDVWAGERANCCDTAMSSGTAPKTYHKKAVKPAHNAAELNSPSSGLQFTFRSYPNRCRDLRESKKGSAHFLQLRFRPVQSQSHLYLLHQRNTVVEGFLRQTKIATAPIQFSKTDDNVQLRDAFPAPRQSRRPGGKRSQRSRHLKSNAQRAWCGG